MLKKRIKKVIKKVVKVICIAAGVLTVLLITIPLLILAALAILSGLIFITGVSIMDYGLTGIWSWM